MEIYMKKRSQEGFITVEACVSVLAFLLLMLLLSGLFLMFMAQNVTGHTLLQTSQSLSFDSYTTDNMKLDEPGVGSVAIVLKNFVTGLFGNSDNNPYFVTDTKWYTAENTDIGSVVKKRFIGYLSGGEDGNEEKADEYLKNMNVANGIEGLDFSGSYVKDDTLYIVLRYELEYYFKIGTLGNVSVEQTACSKLWK